MSNNIQLILAQTPLQDETKVLLESRFQAFAQQSQEWSDRAQLLVVTSDEQTEDMAKAKTARLALKAIRVEADKVRKALKEDSLRYGQAVQSVYNFIEAQIKPIEKHLQLQEEFTKIRQERERQELKDAREHEMKPYAEFVPMGILLEDMTEENYGKLFHYCIAQLKAKKEAEAMAEQERIEKAKQEAIEQERIKAENDRLRIELAEAEKQRLQDLAAQQAILEQERKQAEEAAKAHAEQVKAQREALAAIEAQRKAEEAEKQRLEAIRIAEEKALESAPDKEKLLAFAESIKAMPVPKPEDFNSLEAKVLLSNTIGLLEKTFKYLTEKAEKL